MLQFEVFDEILIVTELTENILAECIFVIIYVDKQAVGKSFYNILNGLPFLFF